MFYGVIVFIFVVVCFLLMAIILMQSSQTGGMGSAMGGGAMNAAFGGQGADKLLVRVTSGLAVTFMVLAITMRPNLIPPMHLSLFHVVSLFPFSLFACRLFS